GDGFDHLFDEESASLRPNLLVGFGGSPRAQGRYARARARGIKVVFSLRNGAYVRDSEFLFDMDGIVTCSRYLADFYRKEMALETTPLPTPIDRNDMVADSRDPVFFTMINPSPEKGLMFLERLGGGIGAVRRGLR